MNTYEEILARAKDILPAFRDLVQDIPYQTKGMLYSEVLFMLACMEGRSIARVLESGTARGQSTLLLARALPDKQIVSIEYDAHSPDVAIASERLDPYANVTRTFGDSNVELPKLIGKDAVAIIDGPKMFLAIRLALRLLATGNVAGVFIHDMNVGTPERAFLDQYLPETRFSDYRPYAEMASTLDGSAQDALAPHQRLGGFTGEHGYGFSLAWLGHEKGRPYRLLLAYSYLYDLLSRPADILARARRKLGA